MACTVVYPFFRWCITHTSSYHPVFWSDFYLELWHYLILRDFFILSHRTENWSEGSCGGLRVRPDPGPEQGQPWCWVSSGQVSQGPDRSGLEHLQAPTASVGSLLVLGFLHCKILPGVKRPSQNILAFCSVLRQGWQLLTPMLWTSRMQLKSTHFQSSHFLQALWVWKTTFCRIYDLYL